LVSLIFPVYYVCLSFWLELRRVRLKHNESPG
jgi:hypothetical protein